MSEGPPILEGKPLSEEQKQLVAFFQELEKGQLDLLDQAGKRIIELTTGLLGILFAVVAFGDKFPPPYLTGNAALPLLVVLVLLFFLSAMGMGMRTMQPRSYRLYRHNLTEMRDELDRIIANKSRSLRLAGVLFWLGALSLAVLIGLIIFSA